MRDGIGVDMMICALALTVSICVSGARVDGGTDE